MEVFHCDEEVIGIVDKAFPVRKKHKHPKRQVSIKMEDDREMGHLLMSKGRRRRVIPVREVTLVAMVAADEFLELAESGVARQRSMVGIASSLRKLGLITVENHSFIPTRHLSSFFSSFSLSLFL